MSRLILYLNTGDRELEQPRKLAGIERFAKTRDWCVRAFRRMDVETAQVSALLRSLRPDGCIIDDSCPHQRLPPALFRGIPFVYLDPPDRDSRASHPFVACDDEAVAAAAYGELSVGNPPGFAVVPSLSLPQWNVRRIDEFSRLCAKAGKSCRVFPGRCDEEPASRTMRLSAWLSALPRHTAVFATNDWTAKDVAETAAALRLRMPQDMTLVGVDGTPEGGNAVVAIPGISTVNLDFELAGYIAAKELEKVVSRRAAEAQSPGKQTDLRTPVRVSDKKLCGSAALREENAAFGPLLVLRRASTRGWGRCEPHSLAAVEIIRREAAKGLTAAALAARFRVSRAHFERRFREAMGRSVLDEILHVRMQAVLDLLSRPEPPIAAITPFCGFSTDQELRKLFRRRFGCSMREWRLRHL